MIPITTPEQLDDLAKQWSRTEEARQWREAVRLQICEESECFKMKQELERQKSKAIAAEKRVSRMIETVDKLDSLMEALHSRMEGLQSMTDERMEEIKAGIVEEVTKRVIAEISGTVSSRELQGRVEECCELESERLNDLNGSSWQETYYFVPN
ncbi:hypothetical protein BJ508DRAFT_306872 [Ascobolus immersus RN42]|uniref:Uncharacterized protein n=1 Tax=Ascobolus immersus RN42 TaxID=1160509 RepID=A0A3N4I6R7_ASCIM|nr:hypothetical protein BJ508DRAFT_306872 [Ascobolus immersus RN42]